jgi:hypothetical protein
MAMIAKRLFEGRKIDVALALSRVQKPHAIAFHSRDGRRAQRLRQNAP